MKKFLLLICILLTCLLLSSCKFLNSFLGFFGVGSNNCKHQEVYDNAIDATCTETGLSEGKHCSMCNEVLVAQTVVDALGHTEVIDASVSATCTTTGLTEGTHCSVCNEVLVAQTVVDALGHTEIIDAAVTPTCTKTGLTEGKHCTACGEVIVAQKSIDALGHTEVIDEAVAMTCTTDGLTTGVHCSVCDKVIIAQEVIPAVHTYGEWESVSESDCFFCGEQKRVCSVEECAHEDTRVIEKLEHNFVQNPETGLFYCEICDARIFNGHLYAAIDKTYHWFDAYKACDALGGHLVTITSAEEQSLIESMISKGVDQSGKWEWINSEGYWLGAIKSTNGWEWVTGEPFNYTKWDQYEPSNDSVSWFIGVNGYAEWHDCQYLYIGNGALRFICEWELDMTNCEHEFSDWSTTAEPNCYVNGSMYRKCYLCGTVESEVLPKIEHSFILNEETGLTTCEHCSAAMYEGRIYKIFSIELSWFDAYAYCDNLGGHLVTITSAEEQEFLNTYMSALNFSNRAWIGAYTDGIRYQWVTDEAFEYTNWSSNQPDCNEGKEFFAEINYYNLGKWNDIPPHGSTCLNLICEWECE